MIEKRRASVWPESLASTVSVTESSTNTANEEKHTSPIIIVLKVVYCGLLTSIISYFTHSLFYFNPFKSTSVYYYVWIQTISSFAIDHFALYIVCCGLAGFHYKGTKLTIFSSMLHVTNRTKHRSVIMYLLNGALWSWFNLKSFRNPLFLSVFCLNLQWVVNIILHSNVARAFYVYEVEEGIAKRELRKKSGQSKFNELKMSNRATLVIMLPFVFTTVFVMGYFNFLIHIADLVHASLTNRSILLIASLSIKFLLQFGIELMVIKYRFSKASAKFSFSYLAVFVDSQLRVYVTDTNNAGDVILDSLWINMLFGVCELALRFAGALEVRYYTERKEFLARKNAQNIKRKILAAHKWKTHANMIGEYVSITIALLAQSRTTDGVTWALFASGCIQFGIEFVMDTIGSYMDRKMGLIIEIGHFLNYATMQSGVSLVCMIFATFAASKGTLYVIPES